MGGRGRGDVSVGSHRFTGDRAEDIRLTETTFQTLRVTKDSGVAPRMEVLRMTPSLPPTDHTHWFHHGHVNVWSPYLPLISLKAFVLNPSNLVSRERSCFFMTLSPLKKATNHFSNHFPDYELSLSSL